MATCITFGKYNKNYKYIFIYIVFRLVFEYFLGDVYPDAMKISFLTSDNFPLCVIVYDIFKYFFMLILGLILLKIELKTNSSTQNESDKSKKNEIEDQLEVGIIAEEEEKKKENFFCAFISRCSIVILYIINNKISEVGSMIGLKGLDFWTVEIIFICFLNYLMFKKKIYSHQKIAIAIILLFATLMKILNIISSYRNDDAKNNNDTTSYYKKIKEHKKYPWIIPIGVILFLVIFFVHAYILCKLKFYFHLKFLSPSRILIYFGIAGTFINLLGSFISNYVECKDNEFFNVICKVTEDNSSKKYFDNFIIFFNNIWRNSRNTYQNIGYIILIFIKLFMTAIYYYLIFLIIDIFSPEYYLCSNSSFFFITKFICLIYYLATHSLSPDFIFETLAQFFALLATIIYLELIELNFCNLNFNLKKNIENRADNEVIELLSFDNPLGIDIDD